MNASFRLLFAAGLAAFSSLSLHARIERVVEKSFPVAGDGRLRVETQGGEIKVVPSADQQVHITAKQKIRASSEAEADELLKKLELTLEQQGNDVRVLARYERRAPGLHFGSWPPVQVDVMVAVPVGFAAELQTSGGGIVVEQLKGAAEIRTSGGAIKLGRMGGTVDARTSGGNINLDSAVGPVTLKTSGGSIAVGRVDGPADLSTSGGGIRIDAASGVLRAHTSGGSIRAGIKGPLTGDCSLTTSGGGVRVTIDPQAAFRLDAATSGGEVDATGLTLTLEKSARDRRQLAGIVNGGGPLLKLRTSGGGIMVRPN